MELATETPAVERWARDTVAKADLPGEVGYDTHDGKRVVVFRPYPRQGQFCELLERHARYRLFGGSAGPGKTLTLLMQGVLVANCVDDGRKVATLCLRRTIPQLEGSFLREFRKHVPRELYRTFNDQKKIVTWWNNATTRFGSMQYEKDVWDYQGHEYARVLWDELTQFLLSQWMTMSIWNRCPVEGVPVGMDGASNPVGPGALFVKALFVDKRPAPTMDDDQRRKYRPEDYHFVPARVVDNPIYANDPAYLAALDALPRVLRQAMLEGLWTIAAGAYFDIYDPALMVVPIPQIEDWWPKWISMDWGFEHNSAIYWHTMKPDNQVLTYRELVVNRTSPRQLAEMIAEKSVSAEGKREAIDQFYLSPDAFAKRTDEDPIAEQMRQVLVREGLPAPSLASTDRVGGWQLMYQLLRDGAWVIGENCPHLMDTLPVLVRDDKDVEDIAEMPGVDDPADSARYGIYSRLKSRIAPLGQRIEKHITSADPSIRAIQHKIAVMKEKQATPGPVKMRRPWFARRWSRN